MSTSEQAHPEHEWLQRLVGKWTQTGECQMAPDQPFEKLEGTEVVRSLGGLWTIGEGGGDTPDGTPAETIMTLGYDPQRKRFVGSFVASMMPFLWLYDGALDEGGQRLVLDSDGPSFTGEGMAKYQDIIEFIDDDHRTLKSQVLTEDGTWRHFMTANYHRVK